MKSYPNSYNARGFEIFDYVSQTSYEQLKAFSVEWICNLFTAKGLELNDEHSIEAYHLNQESNDNIHCEALRAKNRHQIPPNQIRDILINSNLTDCLHRLGIIDYRLWDEGLGWLAFRLIRPGFNDGYPFSKKDWGPGKGTISVWMPILGFDPNQIIAFIPGSNMKEYEKFLPESSKFTPDEFRLKDSISEFDIYRPLLCPGQAIIFSPKTIHTEDIKKGNKTRLSLEFRIIPNYR